MKHSRQLNAFSAAADDLPLFSGTPQPATLEVFAPAEEARQESIFDRREHIAFEGRCNRMHAPEWLRAKYRLAFAKLDIVGKQSFFDTIDRVYPAEEE